MRTIQAFTKIIASEVLHGAREGFVSLPLHNRNFMAQAIMVLRHMISVYGLYLISRSTSSSSSTFTGENGGGSGPMPF